MTPETPYDWRGTPIVPGALVVYGAPVGRSIAMVEGTVDSFTKSGRVNVRIIRRSYGGWGSGREVVHVGADRLTIVETLPPSDAPTAAEKVEAARRQTAEYEANKATHDHYEQRDGWHIVYGCHRCGATVYRDLITEKCPGPFTLEAAE